jgi:hypothetical protein
MRSSSWSGSATLICWRAARSPTSVPKLAHICAGTGPASAPS